jgi:hypothetical protein
VKKRPRERAGTDGACQAIKDDGNRCQGWARESSHFCLFHDPDSRDELRAAQQRGGRANRSTVLPADAPDIPLSTLKDIAGLEAQIINLLLRGKISPKQASSLVYSCSQLARLIEASSIEGRLAALEKAQKTRLPEASLPDPFKEEDAISRNESK